MWVTRSQGSCSLSALQLLELPLQLASPPSTQALCTSLVCSHLSLSIKDSSHCLSPILNAKGCWIPNVIRVIPSTASQLCHLGNRFSTQSHFYFQWLDASLCGLWASSGPPPQTLPCQVSCLNTCWDFYCCCLCPTSQLPSARLLTAHILCPTIQCSNIRPPTLLLLSAALVRYLRNLKGGISSVLLFKRFF